MRDAERMIMDDALSSAIKAKKENIILERCVGALAIADLLLTLLLVVALLK